VGENGAGKSTLIGSVFAALFRQLPGQKRSLYDFATHPQPEIDLTFSVNGARYRSLLKIDPKSRQMEGYLFNGGGKPLTNGKKESFEEFVGKIAGTPEFFLSSIFSGQKRTGNFLSLDRSERKELFIRELLGLDRLRLIAAAANRRPGARSTAACSYQGRIARDLASTAPLGHVHALSGRGADQGYSKAPRTFKVPNHSRLVYRARPQSSGTCSKDPE